MRIPVTERYGAIAQIFHWLTAILVLAAFILGPGGAELRVYQPGRDAGRQLHETLGLCVFVLAVLRMVWRATAARPAPAPVARWMAMTASVVQYGLYLLLFALPLTAVAGAWLEGHPLTLLGGLQIASPFAPSHDIGEVLAEAHGWLGDAIMWLAGLHACAALYHHFIVKDAVLVSMLPRWLPLRPKR